MGGPGNSGSKAGRWGGVLGLALGTGYPVLRGAEVPKTLPVGGLQPVGGFDRASWWPPASWWAYDLASWWLGGLGTWALAGCLARWGSGEVPVGGSPGSVVRGAVGEPEQHRYIYMSWALGGEMGRCCSGLPEDIYL